MDAHKVQKSSVQIDARAVCPKSDTMGGAEESTIPEAFFLIAMGMTYEMCL